MKRIYFAVVRFVGKVLFALLKCNGQTHMDVIDPLTGEVLLEFGKPLTIEQRAEFAQSAADALAREVAFAALSPEQQDDIFTTLAAAGLPMVGGQKFTQEDLQAMASKACAVLEPLRQTYGADAISGAYERARSA